MPMPVTVVGGCKISFGSQGGFSTAYIVHMYTVVHNLCVRDREGKYGDSKVPFPPPTGRSRVRVWREGVGGSGTASEVSARVAVVV